MAELEDLRIKISASADSASKAIESLETSLSRISAALKGFSPNNNATGAITSLARGLDTLKGSSVSEGTVKGIQRLGSAIKSMGKKLGEAGNLSGLSTAASALASVKAAGEGLDAVKIPRSLSNNLTRMATAMSELGNASAGIAAMGQMSTALGTLSTVAAGATSLQGLRIPANLATQMSRIAYALVDLDYAAGETGGNTALRQIAASFAPLSEMGDNGIGRLISALNRLPKTIKELNEADVTTFTAQVAQLTPALESLAQSAGAANEATNGLGRNIRDTMRAANSAGGGGGSSKGGLFGNLGRFVSFNMVARGLSTVIGLSNKYQEDLNLFTAALGKYAAQAQSYADTVSESLGIDPAVWMRNQGVFQTLIGGFGVAEDRAYTMGKNLTQLGYDLSSFFNINVADAMQKIQSGISGELEPLRRLGYDLSKARLEAIALEKGITTSFNKMSQAEKSQLRYEAIMQQVSVSHGDMARTIDAPANQLRVLSAMATQAGREIGNIFIPALNAILPVAIAVVKAIKSIASAIASLFGFTLTDIDYSGLEGATNAADDMNSALGGAGKSAKELKKQLMGFDEINQLKDDSSSGGGGGGGAGIGSDWDWSLSEYDFLGDAIGSRLDSIYSKVEPVVTWIGEHLQEIAGIALGIAATFAGLKIAGVFTGGLASVVSNLKLAAGILATIAVGAILTIHFEKLFMDTGEGTDLLAQIGVTAGTTVLGGALIDKLLTPFLGEASALNTFKLGAGLVLAIEGIVTIIPTIDDMIDKGPTWENIIESLISAAEVGIGAGLLAAGAGVAAGTAAMIGGAAAAIVLGVAAFVAITSLLVDRDEGAGWGEVTLTAEQMKEEAQAIFDSMNVEGRINVMEVAIANYTEAREKAREAVKDLSDEIEKLTVTDPVTMQVSVDPAAASSTLEYLTGTLLPSLNTSLKEKDNLLTVGAQLGGFVDGSGNPINVDDLSLGTFEQQFADTGKALGDALQKGIRDGWTSELTATVALLQNDVIMMQQAMLGAGTQGETKVKLKDMEKRLETYDKDSFLGVYGEYNALKGNTRTQLEGDYDRMLSSYYSDLTYWENYAASLQEQMKNEDLTQAELQHYSQQYDTAMAQIEALNNTIESMDKTQTVDNWMKNLFNDSIFAGTVNKALAASGVSAYTDRMDYFLMQKPGERTAEDLATVIKSSLSSALGSDVAAGLVTQIPDSFYDNLVARTKDKSLVDEALANLGITTESAAKAAGEVVTEASTAGNTFKEAAAAMSKLNIPSKIDIGVSVSDNRIKTGTFINSLNKVGQFASGGFPAKGSLFIAGEAGPEIIGTIGGRTAVMNESQMEAAAGGIDEAALASAIVGAMRSAGMGAVYLDGKQLAASINNETRRMGRSAIVI